MSEQENIQVFRNIVDALNAKDLNRLGQLVVEDCVMESDTLPDTLHGREAWLQAMQGYFTAFPDLHFEIEQIFASGDYVTLRWRSTGTHRGDFAGIPPTNRPGEIHGCTVRAFRDGKFFHEWTYWDTAHLLRQMGVLPSPQ